MDKNQEQSSGPAGGATGITKLQQSDVQVTPVQKPTLYKLYNNFQDSVQPTKFETNYTAFLENIKSNSFYPEDFVHKPFASIAFEDEQFLQGRKVFSRFSTISAQTKEVGCDPIAQAFQFIINDKYLGEHRRFLPDSFSLLPQALTKLGFKKELMSKRETLFCCHRQLSFASYDQTTNKYIMGSIFLCQYGRIRAGQYCFKFDIAIYGDVERQPGPHVHPDLPIPLVPNTRLDERFGIAAIQRIANIQGVIDHTSILQAVNGILPHYQMFHFSTLLLRCPVCQREKQVISCKKDRLAYTFEIYRSDERREGVINCGDKWYICFRSYLLSVVYSGVDDDGDPLFIDDVLTEIVEETRIRKRGHVYLIDRLGDSSEPDMHLVIDHEAFGYQNFIGSSNFGHTNLSFESYLPEDVFYSIWAQPAYLNFTGYDLKNLTDFLVLTFPKAWPINWYSLDNSLSNLGHWLYALDTVTTLPLPPELQILILEEVRFLVDQSYEELYSYYGSRTAHLLNARTVRTLMYYEVNLTQLARLLMRSGDVESNPGPDIIGYESCVDMFEIDTMLFDMGVNNHEIADIVALSIVDSSCVTLLNADTFQTFFLVEFPGEEVLMEFMATFYSFHGAGIPLDAIRYLPKIVYHSNYITNEDCLTYHLAHVVSDQNRLLRCRLYEGATYIAHCEFIDGLCLPSLIVEQILVAYNLITIAEECDFLGFEMTPFVKSYTPDDVYDILTFDETLKMGVCGLHLPVLKSPRTLSYLYTNFDSEEYNPVDHVLVWNLFHYYEVVMVVTAFFSPSLGLSMFMALYMLVCPCYARWNSGTFRTRLHYQVCDALNLVDHFVSP